MHYITKISIDQNEKFISSEIVDHTNLGIASALIQLENCARSFVKKECGKQAAEKMKTITILDWNQIVIPLLDGMLVYRLDSDPHKLHVYQKTSTEVPGTFYGKSIISEFKKVKIFQLVEYKKLNTYIKKDILSPSAVPTMEMVLIGPAKVSVPKVMTTEPMTNVIEELKDSKMFRIQEEKFKNENNGLSNNLPIDKSIICYGADIQENSNLLNNLELDLPKNYQLTNSLQLDFRIDALTEKIIKEIIEKSRETVEIVEESFKESEESFEESLKDIFEQNEDDN